MNDRSERRKFLRQIGAISIGAVGSAWLAGCGAPSTPELTRIPTSPPAIGTSAPPASATRAPQSIATAAPAGNAPDLAVARGASPAAIAAAAVAALGGMERFVAPGSNVIIKPNICNAYNGPEYASTTNPEVVATVVQMCIAAGARSVRVMDRPFGGTAEKAYVQSGIAAAVEAVGGEMELMNRIKYRNEKIPAGRKINSWSIYGDILDADVLINIPIAKNHGNARLTLAMKNMMGTIQDPGGFHSRGLHQCIADLNTVVRPTLTILDAVRILTANGPTGGDLNDVKQTDTIIAGVDYVAVDAYTTRLFGMKPADIDYIRFGADMGLGRMDVENLTVEEIAA